VVVNSHSHGDHVQGNPSFFNRPNTEVVGLGVSALQLFFGIDTWPQDAASFDLGGRELSILPIPGHQGADIAIYDHNSGLLLTGDTVYPGRLFIRNFSTYQASIQRLLDFTVDEATHPVCAVLGTHIEMANTPTVEFPFHSRFHEDEHELELSRAHLVELAEGLEAMEEEPVRTPHDEFVIVPLGL